MKHFLLAAVGVLLTFAANVVSVPTPASPDNLCVGEDCVYPSDNVDTLSYSAAVIKSGKHNCF